MFVFGFVLFYLKVVTIRLVIFHHRSDYMIPYSLLIFEYRNVREALRAHSVIIDGHPEKTSILLLILNFSWYLQRQFMSFGSASQFLMERLSRYQGGDTFGQQDNKLCCLWHHLSSCLCRTRTFPLTYAGNWLIFIRIVRLVLVITLNRLSSKSIC